MNELRHTTPHPSENVLSNETSSILDADILIVDDSALIRELIGAFLQSAGYTNLRFAKDGQNALDLIAESKPDLVILDLEMPIMDGFQVCKNLRAQPETKNLPILIQSGRDTATDLTKAFNFGATDMVLKPVKKYEILARIKVHLENQILVKKLTAYHTRVASELEQARRLQLDICPTKDELKNYLANYNLDFGWHYEPSSEIGGDIGGLFPIDKNKIAFYIADFSGHGVAAALNTFRLQSWLASAKDLYKYPDKLLSELNNFLHENLASGSYATMLFFCLDIKKGELIYSAAGSQPPLIHYPDTSDEFELLSSKGMPLGLRCGWEYKAAKIDFKQNTRMMIYSDALIEVKNPEGNFIGDEGMRTEVSQTWEKQTSHEKTISKLVENFRERVGDEEPDDLTIICLENLNEYSN